MFYRNLFAVLVGLGISFIVITIGITINKSLFFPESEEIVTNWKFLYGNWKKIISKAHYTFFIALLFSAGLASFLGGIVTSFFVKRAKVAYAMFIGALLVSAAWIDIWLTSRHPTWYIVSLNIVLFSFAWLGGKFVEFMSSKIK